MPRFRGARPTATPAEQPEKPVLTLPKKKLLHFLVRRMLSAKPAILLKLQPIRGLFLVFRGGVVSALAFAA
jgi:hypothetical protein